MSESNRAAMTRASHIAIPAHIGLSLALGVTWITQGGRTNTGLRILDGVMDVRVAGVLLVTLTAITLTGRILGNEPLTGVGLGATGGAFALLTGLYAWAVTQTPDLAISICYWPAYVAVCHLASLVSLASGDQPREGGPE